jgi:hypothetical protein
MNGEKTNSERSPRMSDVQIHTTRLDPRANEPLMAIANAGAAAFGYTAELTLDGQLAQLCDWPDAV